MKNKYLIVISFFSWANYGFFYLLSLNKIETILIGVFRELTIIPSLLCGIIFPIWLMIRILTAKEQSKQ